MVFVVPVVLDGKTGNMGVIVHASKDGKTYKTHKIILPDGSAFLFDDEKTESDNKKTEEGKSNAYASNTEGIALAADSVSNPILEHTEKKAMAKTGKSGYAGRTCRISSGS